MEIPRLDLRKTSQKESHRRGLRPAHPGSLCGKNPPAPALHFFACWCGRIFEVAPFSGATSVLASHWIGSDE